MANVVNFPTEARRAAVAIDRLSDYLILDDWPERARMELLEACQHLTVPQIYAMIENGLTYKDFVELTA